MPGSESRPESPQHECLVRSRPEDRIKTIRLIENVLPEKGGAGQRV